MNTYVREDRAEDQREGAGDVHERGQQPEGRREERRDRDAGRGRRARSRARRRVVVTIRTIESTVAPMTAPTARRGQRSFWKYVSTPTASAEDRRRDEVQERQGARALVLGSVADQEREEPRQEEAQREGVAEPGPPQEDGRPEPQPAGGPDGAGQVPGPVQRLVPAGRAGDRLAAGGDPVEQHPEGPDELEAAAPLAPLVEQRDREDQGEDRGQRREDDRAGPRSARGLLVRGDEPEQQAVEQAGRVLVQDAEPRGIERPPPAEAGELGEERAAGGDEQRDRPRSGSCPTPRAGAPGRRRATRHRPRPPRAPVASAGSASRYATSAATRRRPSWRYAARSASSTGSIDRSRRGAGRA